jgi:hypothetical protein
MIKVFENFISESLASEITVFVQARAKDNVWSVSNLTYSPDLVEASTPIFSMELHEDIVKKITKLYTKQFKEFKNKTFNMDYKIYSPNSYITWHGDDEYIAGSTIYLNREYHPNDGGLFLYRDESSESVKNGEIGMNQALKVTIEKQRIYIQELTRLNDKYINEIAKVKADLKFFLERK